MSLWKSPELPRYEISLFSTSILDSYTIFSSSSDSSSELMAAMKALPRFTSLWSGALASSSQDVMTVFRMEILPCQARIFEAKPSPLWGEYEQQKQQQQQQSDARTSYTRQIGGVKQHP